VGGRAPTAGSCIRSSLEKGEKKSKKEKEKEKPKWKTKIKM
jgi:hypothetical protein